MVEEAVIEHATIIYYFVIDFKQYETHISLPNSLATFADQTGDFIMMAGYWLGHARQETPLRDTHIYQQSARTVKKKIKSLISLSIGVHFHKLRNFF